MACIDLGQCGLLICWSHGWIILLDGYSLIGGFFIQIHSMVLGYSEIDADVHVSCVNSIETSLRFPKQ